jgi:RimJ/RimL family protein N-acetyltransferase
MSALAQAQPSTVEGYGLTLRPWDPGLVGQLANWGERGFPYHAFDLGYLHNPFRARTTLAKMLEVGPHRHVIACEGERAVGRASVNLRDDAGLYIWSVHVPPEHEGRGVCRRMLAALMTWLEDTDRGRPFVLTSNTFATHAHRAYLGLGFQVVETRWQYDHELAEGLWKATGPQRDAIAEHVRFMNGRWEVRTHVFRREPGAPMATGPRP